MPIVLAGATSGSATIQATDAQTVTITMPATSGTLAVGGTTPSFSTLTVTGNTYLATTSGNVGIGTSSPTSYAGYTVADVYNGTTGGVVLVRNSTKTGQFIADTNGIRIGSRTNDYLSFTTNDTDQVRIDASGSLGVNTTTPSTYGKFVVNGAGNSNVGVFIGNASVLSSAPTYTGSVRIVDNPTGTTTSGGLEFMTATFGSGYGWRLASIDSTGVQLTFQTRQNSATWSEAMRIDSGGNVLIGTTDSGFNSKIVVKSPASFTTTNYRSDSVTAAGTGWNHFYGSSNSNSVANVSIYGNGNIQNANNSYGAYSDIKLKENIVDATPKLDKLMQVKVRNYNLKGDYEQHKQIGVIAQELEQIFPAMIEEIPDRDAEGNIIDTSTKSVKYSVFVPMLIKAIQELNKKVTDLEEQVLNLGVK